jgi:hypothetical protein
VNVTYSQAISNAEVKQLLYFVTFVSTITKHQLKNSIMDCVPVDERTCCLRLRGKFFNTTLICIHAPTEEKEETETNSFYDKLDCVYQKAPTHDIKISMGI